MVPALQAREAAAPARARRADLHLLPFLHQAPPPRPAAPRRPYTQLRRSLHLPRSTPHSSAHAHALTTVRPRPAGRQERRCANCSSSGSREWTCSPRRERSREGPRGAERANTDQLEISSRSARDQREISARSARDRPDISRKSARDRPEVSSRPCSPVPVHEPRLGGHWSLGVVCFPGSRHLSSSSSSTCQPTTHHPPPTIHQSVAALRLPLPPSLAPPPAPLPHPSLAPPSHRPLRAGLVLANAQPAQPGVAEAQAAAASCGGSPPLLPSSRPRWRCQRPPARPRLRPLGKPCLLFLDSFLQHYKHRQIYSDLRMSSRRRRAASPRLASPHPLQPLATGSSTSTPPRAERSCACRRRERRPRGGCRRRRV